jgi:HAD superfamily hydrolase (TIGR01509 family)
MTDRPVVLLDLDGVLLDNDRYDAEWQRLAPVAFADRLGGNPGAWAAAQHAAWQRIEPAERARYDRLPLEERPTVAEWWDATNAQWVEETCALVGVDAPPTMRERIAAGEHAIAVYFTSTRAAFPGVAEAVRSLARRCELHMSSGNPTIIVEAVLRQLGVRSEIGRAYGSDLAGVFKPGAAFYRAILAAVGARAERTVVVDDQDVAIAAARAVGARTVQVGAESAGADLAIATLTELPAASAGSGSRGSRRPRSRSAAR